MSEYLIFSHAVEAFFRRAMRERRSPQLEAAVKAAGIDLTKPLLPAYTFQTWTNALEATAKVVYPDLSKADAYYEMGKDLVTSYQDTMIGKALFAALRIMGPKRIIERMARSFRTSNNFTEVTVETVDETTVCLAFNQVEPLPTLTQAILAEGLPAAGIRNARVEVLSFDGTAARYRVAWGPLKTP